MNNSKYCLDSNFFIEAWNKYYSPEFCCDYWDIIADLGKEGIVFIPLMVKKEIERVDDELSNWIRNKDFMVKDITNDVQRCLKEIFEKDLSHLRLVDNTKNRSQADPWVIAHAIAETAIVVTKEEKVTAIGSTKIKIPNVCDNMGIRWINDFTFIKEIQLKFSCKR